MNTIDKIIMFHMAVTDMEKAKDFYVHMLGFKVKQDYGQGTQHWVSLDAPGGGASLNLTTAHENMKPGTMKLYLGTSDIEAAHKTLEEKRAQPSAIDRASWGTSFSIKDPDGNTWLVVQS